MDNVLFCDLETSGLDPLVHQTLELAIVPYYEGKVLDKDGLHFYIDHPRITYDLEALKKFGDRINDRRRDVKVLDVRDVPARVLDYVDCWVGFDNSIKIKPTFGGKNFGGFDKLFLNQLIPDLNRAIPHRSVDIGNKFHGPGDRGLPDLELCRKRALACGASGKYVHTSVTHTALEDAALCAELYDCWIKGMTGLVTKPNWSA